MNYRTYLGIFVVVLVSTYLLVRYWGAPSEIMPISVALLILGIGLEKTIVQLKRRKNEN